MNNIQTATISYFKSWTIHIQCVHGYACRYTMFSDTRTSYLCFTTSEGIMSAYSKCEDYCKMSGKHLFIEATKKVLKYT